MSKRITYIAPSETTELTGLWKKSPIRLKTHPYNKALPERRVAEKPYYGPLRSKERGSLKRLRDRDTSPEKVEQFRSGTNVPGPSSVNMSWDEFKKTIPSNILVPDPIYDKVYAIVDHKGMIVDEIRSKQNRPFLSYVVKFKQGFKNATMSRENFNNFVCLHPSIIDTRASIQYIVQKRVDEGTKAYLELIFCSTKPIVNFMQFVHLNDDGTAIALENTRSENGDNTGPSNSRTILADGTLLPSNHEPYEAMPIFQEKKVYGRDYETNLDDSIRNAPDEQEDTFYNWDEWAVNPTANINRPTDQEHSHLQSQILIKTPLKLTPRQNQGLNQIGDWSSPVTETPPFENPYLTPSTVLRNRYANDRRRNTEPGSEVSSQQLLNPINDPNPDPRIAVTLYTLDNDEHLGDVVKNLSYSDETIADHIRKHYPGLDVDTVIHARKPLHELAERRKRSTRSAKPVDDDEDPSWRSGKKSEEEQTRDEQNIAKVNDMFENNESLRNIQRFMKEVTGRHISTEALDLMKQEHLASVASTRKFEASGFAGGSMFGRNDQNATAEKILFNEMVLAFQESGFYVYMASFGKDLTMAEKAAEKEAKKTVKEIKAENEANKTVEEKQQERAEKWNVKFATQRNNRAQISQDRANQRTAAIYLRAQEQQRIDDEEEDRQNAEIAEFRRNLVQDMMDEQQQEQQRLQQEQERIALEKKERVERYKKMWMK